MEVQKALMLESRLMTGNEKLSFIGSVTNTNASHASLKRSSLEKKLLRWDFNFFCIYFMSTYQNNWAWNQNQVDFKDNVKISAKSPLNKLQDLRKM